MKSSQSNFNLRSPSSYLARSYPIATVIKLYKPFLDASLYTCRGLRYRQGAEGAQILGMQLYNCNHFYTGLLLQQLICFVQNRRIGFVGEFNTINTQLQHFKSRRILFNFWPVEVKFKKGRGQTHIFLFDTLASFSLKKPHNTPKFLVFRY